MSDVDVVRGWEAASNVAGRSVASLRKLVDSGRLHAEKDAGVNVFRRTDLEALPAVQRAEGPGVAGPGVASTELADLAAASSAIAVDTSPAPGSDGEIAAIVFADLGAGKGLRQIVVERRLHPDVVRQAYEAWLALEAVDGLRPPEAEARLAQAEATIAVLTAKLSAVEQAANAAIEIATQLAEELRKVHSRLAALQRRPTEPRLLAEGDALRRIADLEARVRAMPAAPLALDRVCTRCGGGRLVVAAACSCCGAGMAA